MLGRGIISYKDKGKLNKEYRKLEILEILESIMTDYDNHLATVQK
jgi:hypothetical protein